MPMAILRMLATTLLVSSTTTASCQTTCSLQRESVQKAFVAPGGIPFNIFTTFFLKASCLQKDYFQLSTHISTKLPTAQQRKSKLLQKFRASVTIFSWEIDLCGIFLASFYETQSQNMFIKFTSRSLGREHERGTKLVHGWDVERVLKSNFTDCPNCLYGIPASAQRVRQCLSQRILAGCTEQVEKPLEK